MACVTAYVNKRSRITSTPRSDEPRNQQNKLSSRMRPPSTVPQARRPLPSEEFDFQKYVVEKLGELTSDKTAQKEAVSQLSEKKMEDNNKKLVDRIEALEKKMEQCKDLKALPQNRRKIIVTQKIAPQVEKFEEFDDSHFISDEDSNDNVDDSSDDDDHDDEYDENDVPMDLLEGVDSNDAMMYTYFDEMRKSQFVNRCTCGNCQSIDRLEENVCCNSIPEVMGLNHQAMLLGEVFAVPRCITLNPAFNRLYINRLTLVNAWRTFKKQYPHGFGSESPRKMRHIAYRQLALEAWEILGPKTMIDTIANNNNKEAEGPPSPIPTKPVQPPSTELPKAVQPSPKTVQPPAEHPQDLRMLGLPPK
ncbi:unnamed protein product [Owenia fusiformis]|uniref:Uncharacterized protein n=1 Tax=Owenia fusiformis TaxID=6347 RepID=A0A8S4QAP7_OWEFU|nr:unnamed protein product [Owenia fusiformis]